MSLSIEPRPNLLLAALPGNVLQRLLPQIERVEVAQGRVLHEAGSQMGYAYFPTTALVSLEYQTADGALMQFAVVGNEGLVGVELLLGGASTPSSAVVQRPGEVLRLPAQAIQDEVARPGPVMHLLLRYTQALITQVAQTAACARHHSLDQRLCRMLLMSLDRVQGDELFETQERMANMLGVRRESVTGAALRLQALGLTRYGRGRIVVLDRTSLEKHACECYAVVKREYDRLLHAEPDATNLASLSMAHAGQATLPSKAPNAIPIAQPGAQPSLGASGLGAVSSVSARSS